MWEGSACMIEVKQVWQRGTRGRASDNFGDDRRREKRDRYLEKEDLRSSFFSHLLKIHRVIRQQVAVVSRKLVSVMMMAPVELMARPSRSRENLILKYMAFCSSPPRSKSKYSNYHQSFTLQRKRYSALAFNRAQGESVCQSEYQACRAVAMHHNSCGAILIMFGTPNSDDVF